LLPREEIAHSVRFVLSNDAIFLAVFAFHK